mmetsp:Transcript_26058/g.47626  ORF Transcript_26058/g.47626 Transcript_26058/m.47626 type:complete len:156 (-) Transcript_26058:143-610(-)
MLLQWRTSGSLRRLLTRKCCRPPFLQQLQERTRSTRILPQFDVMLEADEAFFKTFFEARGVESLCPHRIRSSSQRDNPHAVPSERVEQREAALCASGGRQGVAIPSICTATSIVNAASVADLGFIEASTDKKVLQASILAAVAGAHSEHQNLATV